MIGGEGGGAILGFLMAVEAAGGGGIYEHILASSYEVSRRSYSGGQEWTAPQIDVYTSRLGPSLLYSSCDHTTKHTIDGSGFIQAWKALLKLHSDHGQAPRPSGRPTADSPRPPTHP